MRGGIIACTGNAYCKYAQSNTKGHALEIGDYLDRKLTLDLPINIHVTGCPHSCAQHYIGDIGLLGVKVGGEDGYHVFVGGGFGANQAVGRQIFFGVSVNDLKPRLEGMLKGYLRRRAAGESFRQFTARHDLNALQGIFTKRRVERLNAGTSNRKRPHGLSLLWGRVGVVLHVVDGRVSRVAGDRDHPANFGRLCWKGATCAEPLTARSRLISAWMREDRTAIRRRLSLGDALARTTAALRRIIERHGPDAVAFYVSGQLSTEAQYLANKLCQRLPRTTTLIPIPAFACRAPPPASSCPWAPTAPPGSYRDIEQARLLFRHRREHGRLPSDTVSTGAGPPATGREIDCCRSPPHPHGGEARICIWRSSRARTWRCSMVCSVYRWRTDT